VNECEPLPVVRVRWHGNCGRSTWCRSSKLNHRTSSSPDCKARGPMKLCFGEMAILISAVFGDWTILAWLQPGLM
jgi:hypothetical protein